MIKQDMDHVGLLGDLKDTKYWFKRDLDTMKVGLVKTVRLTPILFLASFIFSLLINYMNQTLRIFELIILSVVFLPIFMLGYFLFYIMVKKGYNIHTHGGTVIDRSRAQNNPE